MKRFDEAKVFIGLPELSIAAPHILKMNIQRGFLAVQPKTGRVGIAPILVFRTYAGLQGKLVIKG
jgi:hypothetical protein